MPNRIYQTTVFVKWHAALKDLKARLAIARRIERLSLGAPGDMKRISGRIAELRIDFGPGYRVYLARLPDASIVLLTGGEKRTQQADIGRARRLLGELTT